MIKHYIEFFYTSEPPVGPVEMEIAERNDLYGSIPVGASGYRFFDRKEEVIDGETVKFARYNISPYVFYGRCFSLKEVRKYLGRKSTFYRFMKNNNYKRAVLTDDGNLICLEKEDKVITMF